MSFCRCQRCRRLPTPREVGDQHEVAVILHLNADAAYAVAAALAPGDTGADEIFDAVVKWEAEAER